MADVGAPKASKMRVCLKVEMIQTQILTNFVLGKGIYVWPDQEDLSMMNEEEVLRVLNPPDLVARGRYAFC